MKPRRMFIGGAWVKAASGKTFQVYDPATEEIVAHVAEGDQEDIHRAVQAARQAFADAALGAVAGEADSERRLPAERRQYCAGLGRDRWGGPGRLPARQPGGLHGSTEAEKLIGQAAAGNLKKVCLELGGKSPNIVLGDVTAGVVEEASKIRLGPGFYPNTTLRPLVSQEQLEHVSGYLASGFEQGAKALSGGKRYGDRGYFVEPTVLMDTRMEMKVVQRRSSDRA
jgi:acyl-CoA reductase-like NAD-dependent aldehyde dehydrogenase